MAVHLTRAYTLPLSLAQKGCRDGYFCDWCPGQVPQYPPRVLSTCRFSIVPRDSLGSLTSFPDLITLEQGWP